MTGKTQFNVLFQMQQWLFL